MFIAQGKKKHIIFPSVYLFKAFTLQSEVGERWPGIVALLDSPA